MDKDTKLIMFIDSLGEDADIDFARQMLESHDWDLEAALLAVTGGDAGSMGGPGTSMPPESPTRPPGYVDADGYRAPMRTGYRDTLIGPSPEDLMFEQAAAHGGMAGFDDAALPTSQEASPAAGHGGGHEDLRRVMRASQMEYQRRADHQEQGLLAEALQASQANYMAEEQRRTAAFIAADHEEQQAIARAIEASFREQSNADAQYRDMLERATEASKAAPGAAVAYPTAAFTASSAAHAVSHARESRPSRGMAATAVPSRPSTAERHAASGTIRTAGSTSAVSPTSAASLRRSAGQDMRLFPASSSVQSPQPRSPQQRSPQSPGHSNGVDAREEHPPSPVKDFSQPRRSPPSSISAIPPSGPRRTSRTDAGVRPTPANADAPSPGAYAARPSAVPPTTGMRSGAHGRAPQQISSSNLTGGGHRSGSQPMKPTHPLPTQPRPPASSSSYRSAIGTPPSVRTPADEAEVFPRVASGARPSGLRPLQSSTTGVRARTPPGAARARTPMGAAPGQDAAVREASEAEKRRREAEAEKRRQEQEERMRTAAAAAAREEELQREADRQAEQRQRREEERRAAEAEQQRQRELQQQRAREAREAREAAESEEKRRRLEAEQRRRDEMEAAEAERNRRKKEAEAERLQRERELRQREVEAAEAKAAAAEAEVRRQAAEEEARRREAKEAEDLLREREEAEQRRREAEGAAGPEEKQKEGSEVVPALMALRSRYKQDPEGLATCLQTLRTYINNLAKNPQEPKFQRINCENAAFKNRVGTFEGSLAVLQACGFEQDGSTLVVGEAYLKSKGPRLFDAVAKLDVLIDQLKR